MELEGATALVTGSASGIGAEVVELLHGAGARVAGLDVNETTSNVELSIICDVSEEREVVSAVARVHEAFGTVGVAVLNAGIGGFGALVDMPTHEWDRVMSVNLRGTFLCLREVSKHMVSAGRGGTICAVTSISGFLADRMMGHYSVSKAGVAEMVRVAARELGPFGIRVNAILPGIVAGPRIGRVIRERAKAVGISYAEMEKQYAEKASLRRMVTAEDVAQTALFLCSAAGRNITGQPISVCGNVETL